ncbi:MAG: 50S ribosomal protein L5 [Verrucomicrobiota bacterium]|jgi:large subunit ribosomal protein L5|nr:50S ribosomal protein L5 [Verrucomicrobiota bacterium]TSA34654.1 MAG: 50S ribosomal protein L5 [Opitutales bacterium]
MSTPHLKKVYLEKVVPELIKSRGYKNVHQVPNLTKIVLNSAFKADADKGHMAEVVKEITKLSGQKPVITKAKKSVASFKVRQGMPLGCVVTLRGARMWEFYLRLTAVALPMIRDFRGTSNRLDGRGNYSLGITDHTIFPETQADGSQRANIGMDVIIVTTANTDDEGRELLRSLGMPFRRSTAATEAAVAATAAAKA